MRPIKYLFGMGKGKECVLVGRGLSAHAVPWPESAEVISINGWPGQVSYKMNYYLFSDLLLYEIHLRSGEVFPEGVEIIAPTPVVDWAITKRLDPANHFSYFYDPHEYPLHTKKTNVEIRSGARALHLALDMGYEKVYLVGFDYKPMENYDTPDMLKRLADQLSEYRNFTWPKDKVVQTNPESRLQF